MLSVGDRQNGNFGNQVSGPPIGILEPGPVWHASAAALPTVRPIEKYLRRAVRKALGGVGDPEAGEWEEFTGYAFHLRRRLLAEEQLVVGEVVDVRGTPEALCRFELMKSHLRGPLVEFAVKELGEKPR